MFKGHYNNVRVFAKFVDVDHRKTKRMTDNRAPYYCRKDISITSTIYAKCYTLCCQKICACDVKFYAYYSSGKMYCGFTAYNCPPTINANPVSFDSLCAGPSGIICPGATHSCGCP